MKHLTLIALLLALLIIAPPAHAQSCTPPSNAPYQTTSSSGEWVAWSYGGPELAYQNCGQNQHVTIYDISPVNYLQFDDYWLPYNLYWNTADGGKFQVDVSTGLVSIIHPHALGFSQSQDSPGEAHSGEGVGLNPSLESPALVETTTPPTVEAFYHLGLNLWQWAGARLGF